MKRRPRSALPRSGKPLPALSAEAAAAEVLSEPDATAAAAEPASVEAPATPLTRPATRKSALLLGVEAALRAKYGRRLVPTAQDAHQFDSVVPCPLAVEFLLGISGMPIGRVIELAAVPGSGKTALMSEIGTWFERHEGGLFSVVSNEDRYDEQWVRAFNADPLRVDAYSSESCIKLIQGVTDEFTQALTYVRSRNKNGKVATKAVPLRTVRSGPMLIGVDSMMGHMVEQTVENIAGVLNEETGIRKGGGEAHGSEYGKEAAKWKLFFCAYTTNLVHWPISLVAINQLRLGPPKTGSFVPSKSKAGGLQIDFAKQYGIELYPSGKFATQTFEGTKVTLRLSKSSGGSEQRFIVTRLLWWYEECEGVLVKRAIWDWDWALVKLLLEILKGDKLGYYKHRCATFGVHVAATKSGDQDNLAWSSLLGLKEKDAAPWDEVGRRLVADETALAAVRKALGILVRPVVQRNFAAQFDYLIKKAK